MSEIFSGLSDPADDQPSDEASQVPVVDDDIVDILDDNLVLEGDDSGVAEVADLLAGALISGGAQASAAALAAYNELGREPSFGGPIKGALPEAVEVEEAQAEA